MVPLSHVHQALEAAGLVQGLPLSELHARLQMGMRLEDTGQRVLAFYLNEMEVGRLYQATGHGSTAHYAEARLGMDRRRTSELTSVGKKLLTLPAIDNAFCRQELGWSKVALLVTVATTEHEEAWLARARELSFRDLALEVRLTKPGSPPRGPGERKGLPEIRFKVDVAVGVLTHGKLDLAKKKLSTECGRLVNDAECLDALADLFLQLEEDGSVPGKTRVLSSLYRIVLRPDDDGRGLLMESDLGPLPIEGGDAIRCDGEVVSLRDRQPQGQSETAPAAEGDCAHAEPGPSAPKTPPWLRRRVLARDAHRCRSCRSRHRLMVHHIQFRSAHGATTVRNLVTLCVRCHGLVHDGLLVLVGTDAEHIRFVDATGEPLEERVPRASGDASPALRLSAVQVACVGSPASSAAHAPVVPQVTTLASIPDAIDGRWWERHAHLIRCASKGLEFEEGVPLPESEATPPEGGTPASPTFHPAAMRRAFGGIVGQDALLARLEATAQGSAARGRPFPHTLLTGPAGTGKTTLASALAAGFGRRFVKATGPLLQDVHALLRLLGGLREGDVLFVEEVHAVPRAVLEALYEAMAERRFALTLHTGVRARSLAFVLPGFTLVAATTEDGDLPIPFVGRFGLRECLGFYAKDVLAALVTKQADAHGFALEADASARLAEVARGTPREALRLLDRVLDDAAGRGQARVDGAAVSACLRRLGYDTLGLEPVEQRYVSFLRRSVAPVPVARLARILGASVRTLLRDVEPFLFRLGLVDVGPRGRTAGRRPRLLEAQVLA